MLDKHETHETRITQNSLIPLYFMMAAIAATITFTAWLTTIANSASNTDKDLQSTKISQSEVNKQILVELRGLREQIGDLKTDVAVVKRLVRSGDR